MSDELEALSKRVAELEAELRRSRTAALPANAPGWTDDEDHDTTASHEWLTWLEPPYRPRPRIPRLPFEILFLAACAVAAGVADLDPLIIAAVMAVAWALVTATELTASRADRRRHLEEAALPARIASPPELSARPDPAWFAPPVEQTVVNAPAAGAGDTAVTRIRPASPVTDAETTASR